MQGHERVLWWILLNIPGMICGLVGLFSLVVEEIHGSRHLQIVTEVFGAAVWLFLAIAIFGEVEGIVEENSSNRVKGFRINHVANAFILLDSLVLYLSLALGFLLPYIVIGHWE